jgi:hypothetical protein
MKSRLAASFAILALASPSFAHRLDEYLQATLLSIEKGRVDVYMRLVPGVAVAPQVLASIDANGDEVISPAEARAYAEAVLREVSLHTGGGPSVLQFSSIEFPPLAEIRDGTGQIQLRFQASLPAASSTDRIVFENHHLPAISVYLANCLAPPKKDIRILGQNRNRNQSWYQVDYAPANAGREAASAQSAGFASLFRLGIRHIAEGTDHLLFLLALLLPAPLTAVGSRWAGPVAIRTALMRILQVVTAFTVGHSLTLALAGLGLIHMPARPVEALIALSILISAVHALRPIFPGREAVIAAFFGLIHGLAFASAIDRLGLSGWQRITSILAFNVGIETMQLVVVASVLPSLLLLSRTRAYFVLRLGGGVLSGLAALAWMVERLLNIRTSIDLVVERAAQQAIWIAAGLLILSLLCRRGSVFGSLAVIESGHS